MAVGTRMDHTNSNRIASLVISLSRHAKKSTRVPHSHGRMSGISKPSPPFALVRIVFGEQSMCPSPHM